MVYMSYMNVSVSLELYAPLLAAKFQVRPTLLTSQERMRSDQNQLQNSRQCLLHALCTAPLLVLMGMLTVLSMLVLVA